MAESIFTSQTPVTPDADDGPSTLATVFTTAVAGTIDGIRWFTPTTLPSGGVGACQALLYRWDSDVTGTLLGQVSFGPLVAGTWNSVNFAAPIAILAGGQRYVAAIFTPNHYCFTNFVFTSSAITNGNLTAIQNNNAIPARNGKFIQNATPAYPTQMFRESNYFVDVLFTASAAPTGGATVAVGTADETDAAFGITPLAVATVAVTGAAETDAAFAITPAATVTLAVDTAAEVDEAFPIAVVAGPQTIALATADEVDAAFATSPSLAPRIVGIGVAEETDEAFPITAAFDQVVDIATAEEMDTASAVTARSSGVGNGFNSVGPCNPLDSWEPIWCEELSPAAAAVTGDAVQMAADVLWILSGQRFGLCTVTLRPCREDCSSDWLGWNDWWPGVGGQVRSSTGGGPRPWWYNGVWYNICGGCTGTCSCTLVDVAYLPAPTRTVVEVKLDGNVMDPSLYRVDENRKLVRLDGELWPMCQNMGAPDDRPGTWSVTITVGEDVPLLARRAVGQLAAELAKDCAGEACMLPYEITSLSRQGVNLSFGSPNEVDPVIGQLNLQWVSLFINTYNPNKLAHRAKTYDVDRNPRPWSRVDTI